MILGKKHLIAAAAISLTVGLLSACGGNSSAAGHTSLSLVGFAVPKAGNNAAQAAFAKTAGGTGVTWKESYGASGDQSRAVASGLKADYVHFSLTPDVTRLVDAGLIDKNWDQGANHGIVTDSVVVLVVRKGNPKHIRDWDDIVKPGIGIVTPNPGSSGSARWNILGAYQSVIDNGGSEADGVAYLTKLFNSTKALPGSGRDATTAFQSGTGDVLISYENEAILARQNGEAIDYVVPRKTLLIENPAAVTKNANPKAKAFLDFALSPQGQAQYVRKGFRPLRTVKGVKVGIVKGANDPANPFPTPEKVFTIDADLGGWSAVNAKFFDEKNGIVTTILQRSGRSS